MDVIIEGTFAQIRAFHEQGYAAEDDDLWDLYQQYFLVVLSFISLTTVLKLPRNSSYFEQRLVWEEYAYKHTVRGTFKRRLRMSRDSFDLLLSYISIYLVVNERMASLRGGMIIPELCLYSTLRWLAGGSYLDITDIVGVSVASFYRIIWKTVMAIVLAPELSIDFPTTADEIASTIAGFAEISFNQAITNCVGVSDGFLLRTKVPSKEEAGNVRCFFSGHYQCYGVNIQAVTDHLCRFLYIAVAGPGVSKDRDAAEHCGLTELVNNLPHGICVIGDAAYEPSEHMIPIYQGQDKRNPKYDNFNFYASQLRIRVEMVFGMMCTKWGVLNRPSMCKLKNIKWMVQAIGRLHNYCINERLMANAEEEWSQAVLEGKAYLPSTPHQDGDPINLDALFVDDSVMTFRGHSELREAMADRVASLGLTRPAANRTSDDDQENDE